MRIPLGPADLHILLALGRGPLHGLGIAKDVARVTEDAVILGPATLYRTLKEMTQAGLIEVVAPPQPDSDPRRKYYGLTEPGLGQLRSDLDVVQKVAKAGRSLLRAHRAGAK